MKIITFASLIALINKLLARTKGTLKWLVISLCTALILGIGVIIFIFQNENRWKDMGPVFGASVSLVGVIFGTVVLSLLKDIILKREQNVLAKDLKGELDELSVSKPTYEQFQKKFFEVLETIFKSIK